MFKKVVFKTWIQILRDFLKHNPDSKVFITKIMALKTGIG